MTPEVSTPQSRFQLGVARGDITPPVGIYHRMWGAATHERATGVHRPLSATVACIRPLHADRGDGQGDRFLLAVDHCLLWGTEQQRLVAGLCEKTGLSPAQIVMAYSHTHAGGLIDLSRRDCPGGELLEPYLNRLVEVLADLVQEAADRVEPAAIVYGQARCNLAAERDFFDQERGQFVCGYNPEGLSDDTVLIARAHSAGGVVLATFVNYACHPTTLAFSNTLISPDFPGAMRELVEEATGAPCVFLQGASADLGPREGFVGDPGIADRNGRQLGYAVLSALAGMPSPGTVYRYQGPVVSGATLGIWENVPQAEAAAQLQSIFLVETHLVPLAYRPELPRIDQVLAERTRWLTAKTSALETGNADAARDCHAMVERMDRQLTRLSVLPPGSDFPFPVQLWRLGDAVWVAVEGELYQVFQRSLRERFPGQAILVITLANGSRCSYIPPAETYGKGIYQESIALLARGSHERLLAAVEGQVRSLLSR